MELWVFFVLSAVALNTEAAEWHHKPKTTTTESEPTTTTEEWITEPMPPTRPPTCKPISPPILPPILPPIYPICCGQNEIYLPPRIAPYCDVHCKDMGKKCQMRYDIAEPFGCYCLPGYCRNSHGKCIAFCEAFTRCY